MNCTKWSILFGIAGTCFTVLARPHSVSIDHPVMSPDEGLLFGNGDLSCSVYQTADDLIFRLGKGDVWDRRFDFSKQPKPPTQDEIIDGVLNCGWKVEGWDARNIEEQRKMPKGARLLEITHGKTALRAAPYPNPKPTGELRLHLPRDLGAPDKVLQTLHIEEGRVHIVLSWKGGAFTGIFDAVIDPEENVLAVDWRVEGWNDNTQLINRAPVYAQLIRWADPDYETFMRRQNANYPQWPGFPKAFNKEATPLPAPTVIGDDTIEQTFYPDRLFPKGFKYRLALHPLAKTGKFWRPTLPEGGKDAYFIYIGETLNTNGTLAVSVRTSNDKTFDPPALRTFADYRERARQAGVAYWAKSNFTMPGDAFMEDLWYAVNHARRSVLSAKGVPPGMFFPSAIDDYSRWNGDYHCNYNYQSIFFGDFAMNRLEQAEAFMNGLEFNVPLGRKIAKDYYGCRGVFFHHSLFPCEAEEDYNGTLPLGRMVYSTGWLVAHYWDYYRYTLDRAFLAKRGYPMIKDAALFYSDFLKKAPTAEEYAKNGPAKNLPPHLKDGLYHVFPSVQAESGFKSARDFCDKGEPLEAVRLSLWRAIEASKVLGVDADLRADWQEKLDHLPRANEYNSKRPYERYAAYCRPVDEGGDVWKPAPAWDGKPAAREKRYLGVFHWVRQCWVRGNDRCIPERDFDAWRNDLKAWTHANGIPFAMGINERTGGWTESLGCMAPFQEMVLQSWDGALRFFPRWPRNKDVKITGFRAQGAFLVDAEWKDGKPGVIAVTSEKGADCSFHGDWVVTCKGAPVAVGKDALGRPSFKTIPGGVYAFTPATRQP